MVKKSSPSNLESQLEWYYVTTQTLVKILVQEGDTVEIDLSNAADAGVTHSIDLHAVNGPGGGASIPAGTWPRNNLTGRIRNPAP